MKKTRHIIGLITKISFFLIAMILLVVRSIGYSFFPVDFKHIFLTAAILGLLFLFFNVQVKLNKTIKVLLTIVFIITAFLIYYIPQLKVELNYLLTLKDELGNIEIKSNGLDEKNEIRFLSHRSPDSYKDIQILDHNFKRLEYSIEELKDPLRFINYFLTIKNLKKDVIIKYKMKNRFFYLNDVLMFPEPDLFKVGNFKVIDESVKFNFYAEFPFKREKYNLSAQGIKDLRYSIILVDEDLQIKDIDTTGKWRFISNREYINDDLVNFLNDTQINMKKLYGKSFNLDFLVSESFPTGKHKKKGKREIIVFQPRDLLNLKTVIHELFHCYHTNLWFNEIIEGITEFLTHIYSIRHGISTQKEFEDKFLEYYAEYYNFPFALERSISDIDKKGMKYANNLLKYYKGFLISLMIDKRLKEIDENKNFVDFLIMLSSKRNYINNNKFIVYLNRYSGDDFQNILIDYIQGSELIKPEDCISTDYRIIQNPSCVTFIGIKAKYSFFDTLVITEIHEESPFWGTGLEVGDEIIKWGVEKSTEGESNAEGHVILKDMKQYANFLWTGLYGRDDLFYLIISRKVNGKKLVVNPVCVPGIELSIVKR